MMSKILNDTYDEQDVQRARFIYIISNDPYIKNKALEFIESFYKKELENAIKDKNLEKAKELFDSSWPSSSFHKTCSFAIKLLEQK